MCATTNQELQMLDSMALEFAASELLPEREDSDEYPFKPLFAGALKKASDVGFFSLMLPEDAGGSNRSMKALCTVLAKVSQVDASLGGVVFTNALAQETIICAGALDMIAEGELLGCTPFDDPANTGNCATARAGDEGYLLNGKLDYVVLGELAAHVLVTAKVEGQPGLSLFLVETDRDEVRISEPIVSLGLHACPAVDMLFRDAPASLVGEAGAGARYLSEAADRLSVACAAMSAGLMAGSLATGLEYARERLQGGRLIVDWSQVRMMMADIAIQIKSAELIVDAATAAVDDGVEGWQQASRAAALHVCPIACDATNVGIQLLGGNGYMHEYGQEKRFRDARQVQMLLGMPPIRKLSYIQGIIDGGTP